MAHFLAQEDAERAIWLINSEDEKVQTAVLRYLMAVTEAYWRLENRGFIRRVVETAVSHPPIQPTPHQKIIWRCGSK
ncbi:MAG: hypothetical protein ACE5E7_07325 [Anaerolineae bacterium]